jgi:hypothetical protein
MVGSATSKGTESELHLVSVVLASRSCCSQMPVTTAFEMRGDAGVVRNYGRLLVELASVVPDGMVGGLCMRCLLVRRFHCFGPA